MAVAEYSPVLYCTSSEPTATRVRSAALHSALRPEPDAAPCRTAIRRVVCVVLPYADVDCGMGWVLDGASIVVGTETRNKEDPTRRDQRW